MSNFDHIKTLATPIDIQLRWSDQDINGHVNNARILTLMEEARIRVTKQWTDTVPGVSGPRRVVRALNSIFNHEAHYGKETTVWVWIPKIGNTSFIFGHLLTQDGQPCVYTEVTMVVVDEHTGQPKPHDEEFRRILEAHSGPAFDSRIGSPRHCIEGGMKGQHLAGNQ